VPPFSAELERVGAVEDEDPETTLEFPLVVDVVVPVAVEGV
jgi:hypothetical protein